PSAMMAYIRPSSIVTVIEDGLTFHVRNGPGQYVLSQARLEFFTGQEARADYSLVSSSASPSSAAASSPTRLASPLGSSGISTPICSAASRLKVYSMAASSANAVGVSATSASPVMTDRAISPA